MKQSTVGMRLGALVGSASLLVGLSVAAAPAAAGAIGDPDTSYSYASAQYLSGHWSTPGVSATYSASGTELPTESAGGAAVSASAGSWLTLGAGGEYAEAASGGKSWAASGRVGAAGNPAASAHIDLSGILAAAGLSDVLSEFTLDLHEIAGVAAMDAGNSAALATSCASMSAPDHCRDYTLKAGQLHIQSGAISRIMGKIASLAGKIDALIPSYYNGPVPSQVNQAVTGAISPLVSSWFGLTSDPLGSYTFQSATIPTADISLHLSGTIASALADILGSEHHSADGSVSINLATGIILIDYTKLVGNLNNLNPNTPFFDDSVASSIRVSLDSIIDGIANEIPSDIEAILKSIFVAADSTMIPELQYEIVSIDSGACKPDGYVNLGFLGKYCWDWNGQCEDSFVVGGIFGIPEYTVCSEWEMVSTTSTSDVRGSLGLQLARNVGGDPLSLWDFLHGHGMVNFSLTWDADDLGALPPLLQGQIAVQTGIANATSPWGLSTLGLDSLMGSGVDALIGSGVTALASGAKAAGHAGTQAVVTALEKVSAHFGGTINVQEPGPVTGSYRETALRLWAGGHTVNLGTAIVGPNGLESSVQCEDGQELIDGECFDFPSECDEGFHNVDDECIADETSGGSTPGGSTPGGVTPFVPVPDQPEAVPTEPEVGGVSQVEKPAKTQKPAKTVKPTIEVKGESKETAAAPSANAKTGETISYGDVTGLALMAGLGLLLGAARLRRRDEAA